MTHIPGLSSAALPPETLYQVFIGRNPPYPLEHARQLKFNRCQSSNLFEMRKYLTINTGTTANSKDQIFLVTSSQRVSERGEQLFSEVSEQNQMALVFL